MSDDVIWLVPTDPRWQPSREAAGQAVAFLKAIAPEGRVETRFTERTELFDCGENLSSISCPHCGTDASSWWHDAMDAAFEGHFEDLSVTPPCCGVPTTLNNLAYDWPMAFGRFGLGTMNANIGELSAADHLALEVCLGCPLRVVYEHI